MSYWRTLFDRSRKPSKSYYPVAPIGPPATTTTTTVTVSQAPSIVLGPLSFSVTSFTVGAVASGTINGATALSTITAAGLPAGLTINGAARTWAWDGTGTASTGSFTLTETLAGAVGSPKPTTIGYTINAAATGLATPALSIQSATGAAPLVFSLTDTGNSVQGLYYRLQVSNVLNDTQFLAGNITQDILFQLDASSVAALDKSIGLTTPSGDFSARIFAAQDNDAGTVITTNEWNGFAMNSISLSLSLSAASNVVSGTITASVAVWSTSDKSPQIVLSNSNLTMQGTAGWGAYQFVGASIAGASKSEWSFTLDLLATDTNRSIAFGRYDGTTNFASSSTEPGVGDAHGYAAQVTPGSTSVFVFDNNATTIGNFTLGTAVALSDKFSDAVDISGAAGTHTLKLYRNGTQIGTTMTGLTLTGFTTAFIGVQSNEKLTGIFGLPTSSGYPIYG